VRLDGRAFGGQPELEVDRFLKLLRSDARFSALVEDIQLRARSARMAETDKSGVTRDAASFFHRMLVQERQRSENRLLKKLPKESCNRWFCLHCYIGDRRGRGGVLRAENWTALTETEASITKLTDQIRQGERQARGAQEDVGHRAEVKSFVEAQQAAMVSGDPFAWVVREISLLAEQHPVRISALHPGIKLDTTEESKGRTYTSGIDVSGTYDQIGAFVRDLENKFSTAEIRSLSLGATRTTKASMERL